MLPEGLRKRVIVVTAWLLSGRKFDLCAQHMHYVPACCARSNKMLNTSVGRDQDFLREQRGQELTKHQHWRRP